MIGIRKLLTAASLLCLTAACGNNGTEASEVTAAEAAQPAAETSTGASHRNRLPEDEVIYFVLPDRFENGDPANDTGGFEGGYLDHGFNPTHKGFYHGGDLKGLTSRLDYLEGLGITAIWFAPIYKNKPVQGAPGFESSGYHGYWITDFTQPDPHFGSSDDLKAFIDAAHSRGMKVFFDIITNHTADVISYRECHDPAFDGEKVGNSCPYRSKADYPYTTLGDASGERINEGFMGDGPGHQTAENFSKLTRFDYAYTPYIPEGEENVKVPAWLNDVRYYHNRGETTFEGENSLYGDFAGLDDLMTEDPFVVQGFIDIYKDWISEYKVDGFRIDTARHVNAEFWQEFLPAVIDHADAEGIPNFYVFGEVYDPDPGSLARFTRVDNFPLVLDFAFQSAVYDVLVKGAPTERFTPLFRADDLYEGGEARARQLPVFIGNHDMGRIGHFLQRENPGMSNEEMLKRSIAAHAIMFFARGVPVIYYGDEQGFTGDGNDQDARENMFPSQVDIYNDNVLMGTSATTAEENFDTSHPLYVAIAEMAKHYKAHKTLRRGKQLIRQTEIDGGMFAFSRIDEQTGEEFLIILNTSNEAQDKQIEVDVSDTNWESIRGDCPAEVTAPGSYGISIDALDYMICRVQ